MPCPVCGQRKGRRDCPALRQTICTVCCGTKRLVEINCPSDCVHLVAAREHPAAAVKRRQERDLAVLLPTIQSLTERQHQLFFVMHVVVARHKPEGFGRLVDDDVAEATAAFASTLETAARGVIYEHTPESATARKLLGELKATLAEIREHGQTVYDHEVAVVLRAIERGARETRAAADGSETAYLSLMARLLNVRQQAAAAQEAPGRQGSLILP